jgi:hypothetical protein
VGLLLSLRKFKTDYFTGTECVISRGIITKGVFCFSFRTYLNAWGSKNMLNYAAGELLPSPIAPPKMTIFYMF